MPALRETAHFRAVLRAAAAFGSVRQEAAAVLEVDAEAPLGIKTLLAAIDMAQDVVASDEGKDEGVEAAGGRGGAGSGEEEDGSEGAVVAAAAARARRDTAWGAGEGKSGDGRRLGLRLTADALGDQLRLAPRGLRKQARNSPDDDPNNPTRGSVVDATAKGAGRKNATSSRGEDDWGW